MKTKTKVFLISDIAMIAVSLAVEALYPLIYIVYFPLHNIIFAYFEKISLISFRLTISSVLCYLRKPDHIVFLYVILFHMKLRLCQVIHLF